MDINDELEIITIYREKALLRPRVEDMLAMVDADEHKLPALSKFLQQTIVFQEEMASAGLELQGNAYHLKDAGCLDYQNFEIVVKSSWLNPQKRHLELQSGFEFRLFVAQYREGEISELIDKINIHIKHLNVSPASLASREEYIKYRPSQLRGRRDSFFENMSLVHTGKVRPEMTLKASAFKIALKDAWTVMQKIITLKQYLISISVSIPVK